MSSVKNVIRDNYNMMLLKDYLGQAIKDAGFSHAEISKTPMGTKVALYVTRPGIVIGRKGAGIRDLTDKLASDFGLKNPQVMVNEVGKPELSPSVMCNRMASHIERGTAFRRATMWTLKQVMDSGAMGVQITISGKLRGDRSAFEKHTAGILPRAGHHAETIVDEDIAHVQTPMGLIGIRIRIAKKEKFVPEFELKAVEKQKAGAKEGQEGGEAPKSDGGEAPKSDGGEAPKSDGGEAPKSDGGEAPKSDGGEAPKSDGGEAPKSDGGEAPKSDGGEAPKSDGGEAPKSDGGEAPKSDGGEAPKSDGGSGNEEDAERVAGVESEQNALEAEKMKKNETHEGAEESKQ